MMNGYGVYHFPADEKVYSGDFVDDIWEGHGWMEWIKEKRIVEGEWKDGKLDGFGSEKIKGKQGKRGWYIKGVFDTQMDLKTYESQFQFKY
jgi:hypothetical protein